MNPAAAYIMQQEQPFRGILLYLQTVIEREIPGISLKYKWKIPFYYLEDQPFCYLNCSKGYVDLGFWHSAHLTVHPEHLKAAGRKVVRTLRYTSLEELDQRVLVDVLRDAYAHREKGFWK